MMVNTIGKILVVVGLLISFFTLIGLRKEMVGLISADKSPTQITPFFWSPITGSILVLVGALALIIHNLEKHPMDSMINRK